MYHYTQCGLDNIWLLNGYHEEDLGEYGATVVVERADELERVIALHLAKQERPLTGQEFRFLRVMLDLSQTSIGRRLGKDYQTVARWEADTHKAVPRFADASIRARYLESIGERPLFTQIEDRLAEIAAAVGKGSLAKAKLAFEERPGGQWSSKQVKESELIG
ncbi:hypothetical protein [Arenibaculum sp.]|jgi:DNA-binding transcriptional regulator YiaG|uniref:hypothetical protein n=1 Tax=Arenibaculum sp. TaxID=2865862 RepID=UPI002E0E784C|nr:hypothetical protein [Arenibaculum sp.]